MFQDVTTTTMIVGLIALLMVILLVTLFVLLLHSGIFTPIDDIGTGKPPVGQVIIAYRFLKGPYNQAGQTFTEAAMLAPDNKTLGIYYDDPSKVQSKNLRYVVGSILSAGSEPVPEDQVKLFTAEGFKILHLPEVTYAVRTKFPHVTSLSILIGIYKAYPSLNEYIAAHKLCAYPFLEYYDGESIHFMAPLSKQEEFFVPEVTRVHDDGDLGTTLDSSQASCSVLSGGAAAYRTMDSFNETGGLSQADTEDSLLSSTDTSVWTTTQDSPSDTETAQLSTPSTPQRGQAHDKVAADPLSKSVAAELTATSLGKPAGPELCIGDAAALDKPAECPESAQKDAETIQPTEGVLLKDLNNSNAGKIGESAMDSSAAMEEEMATSDDSSCSFEVVHAETLE